jgi:hypothetical protein
MIPLTFVDSTQSISIQPSLTGCLSQGIALCGKNLISDAMRAFDLAFMFTDQDPKTIHFLLLIKARQVSVLLLTSLSLSFSGYRTVQPKSTPGCNVAHPTAS